VGVLGRSVAAGTTVTGWEGVSPPTCSRDDVAAGGTGVAVPPGGAGCKLLLSELGASEELLHPIIAAAASASAIAVHCRFKSDLGLRS
jgi:hypothetical protein